jgi:hypothetical protein
MEVQHRNGRTKERKITMQNWFALMKKIAYVYFLFFFALSTTSSTFSPPSTPPPPNNQDFPIVDPFYIYNQLAYLATHFQHREAGYDTNLPANINGHDEFANYWSQEMLNNLQSFGAHVRRDPFPVQGWRNHPPATVPAFNVEVTIPGASQPDQVVIIGCHYDGEAVSTQSAYDDTSGCAIELGIARGLALYWQSHHLYPARTLRFLLFDAEEQGLYGSFHYVNETSNGDLQNIVAMFNEEQSGMAYPVRYLGMASNPQMPLSIEMTPVQHTTLTGTLLERSQHFRALMQEALPAVFAKFRALGFLGLTYHNQQKQDSGQDIFTPQQTQAVHIEDDQLGGSDQVPFTLAGLPCATFVGNATYYDSNPPPGSYPYDQAADTITLLNTYADGGPNRSAALSLALALPGMFTGWMLHQSAILGEVPAQTVLHAGPLFGLSSLPVTQVGQAVTLDAATTFDPLDTNAAFSYLWNFGDGTTATGVKVVHSYKEAGHYTLTVKVRSASGTRQLQTAVDVVVQATAYQNDYASYQPTGYPRTNPQVLYPVPDVTRSDAIIGPVNTSLALTPVPQQRKAPARSGKSLTAASTFQPALIWLISLVALIVVVTGLGLLIGRKRRI